MRNIVPKGLNETHAGNKSPGYLHSVSSGQLKIHAAAVLKSGTTITSSRSVNVVLPASVIQTHALTPAFSPATISDALSPIIKLSPRLTSKSRAASTNMPGAGFRRSDAFSGGAGKK